MVIVYLSECSSQEMRYDINRVGAPVKSESITAGFESCGWVCVHVAHLQKEAKMAKASIVSGKALAALDGLIAITNGKA